MSQAQQARQHRDDEHEAPPSAPTESIADQQLVKETDELLEQIDGVLQETDRSTCMCGLPIGACFRNRAW